MPTIIFIKKKISVLIKLFLIVGMSLSQIYGTKTNYKINSNNENDNLVLAADSIAYYTVYYGTNEDKIVKHAALELGQWLDALTGAVFPATTNENESSKRIIVGKNNPLTNAIDSLIDYDSISVDGFRIFVYGEDLYIVGNTTRGTMYGVYYLLDIYFGVRWFSPVFEYVPHIDTLTIPTNTNDLQNPHFAYREIFSDDTEDGYYRAHNRLNGNRWGTHRQYNEYDSDIDTWSEDGPAGGHNFHEIVSENYHYGGQVKMMAEGARSAGVNYFNDLINTNGDKYWYAFSQEDNGWDPDYESKAFADAHGGVLSAPLIDMVTNVATRVRQTHPKAHLSTNAYQWSFMPPTDITVPEYVMVEIAPIEANFGYPYNNLVHNENIYNAFTGWNQIASSLGVWDYITNFQNYLQPLPNIYPMFQNIQFFSGLEAIRSYFGEGAYNTQGAEFAELRAWVAARLLWNPDQNYKALINEFCDGYYGPASTYIKQYIDLLHNSFKNTNDRISSKQRITSKYLNLDFILQADQLMANADAIATGEYAKHVHEVRLGIDMTILLLEHMYKVEAAERGINWVDDTERRSRFNQYVAEANITDFSENAPIENLFAAMNIPRKNPSKPDIVSESEEWIDYQDMDFAICCGALLIEDDKASDNGTVKLDNDEWAIQMKLDMLPPEEEWTLYAYVRTDVKNGVHDSKIAFNMGVYPYSWISPKVSEVKDGEYHVFKFPNMPISYQTGSYIWFSCDDGANYIAVDRVIAVSKLTDVKKNKNIKDIFKLEQNYPNPFNPSTEIKFSIPKNEKVSLTIYDTLGRKITTLIDNKIYSKGWHSIKWNSQNQHGNNITAGVYLYQLRAGANIKTRKMILLK